MRATRGDVSGGWGAGTCGGVGVGLGRTGGGGEGLVRSGDGGEGLVWSGVGEAVSALVERDWFGLVVGRGRPGLLVIGRSVVRSPAPPS